MPMYNNQRDDIADTLMQQRGASTFDYGLAGLGSAAPAMSPMTGPVMSGLPQTPAGGVPGAGIGPAAPSTVALPPQRLGLQGAMPTMRGMGQMSNTEAARAGQSLQRMQPPLGGIGQMSDYESAQAGQSLGRMRRPRY